MRTLRIFSAILPALLAAGVALSGLPEAVDRVDDAVVTIQVQTGAKKELGSGFLVSADGQVVTSAHVVGKADKVLVKLADGTEITGKVVAVEKDEDIALVKIDAKHLPAVQFGSSQTLRKGQAVAAIGAPMGLEHSVTTGVISNPRQQHKGRAFIQTDVALNPGNSGGPLIDENGLVIGMNVKVAAGAENVGFAVPCERVCRFLDKHGVGYSASIRARKSQKEPVAGEPVERSESSAQEPDEGEAEEGSAEGQGEKMPRGLWSMVLVAAVVSLVVSVLASSFVVRSALKAVRRSPTTWASSSQPRPTERDDLSDIDIQLY